MSLKMLRDAMIFILVDIFCFYFKDKIYNFFSSNRTSCHQDLHCTHRVVAERRPCKHCLKRPMKPPKNKKTFKDTCRNVVRLMQLKKNLNRMDQQLMQRSSQSFPKFHQKQGKLKIGSAVCRVANAQLPYQPVEVATVKKKKQDSYKKDLCSGICRASKKPMKSKSTSHMTKFYYKSQEDISSSSSSLKEPTCQNQNEPRKKVVLALLSEAQSLPHHNAPKITKGTRWNRSEPAMKFPLCWSNEQNNRHLNTGPLLIKKFRTNFRAKKKAVRPNPRIFNQMRFLASQGGDSAGNENDRMKLIFKKFSSC